MFLKKPQKISTNNFAFTLVELLIVIAILAILVAIAYAAIQPGERLKQSRDAQRLQDVQAIAEALRRYSLDHGEFPQESDGYNGYIGIGAGPDSILENYLGYVPADPSHDGTTYYYYYDPYHSCWNASTSTSNIIGFVSIYNFESDYYKDNYSNMEEVCPGGGTRWGREGNYPTTSYDPPDYVVIFSYED